MKKFRNTPTMLDGLKFDSQGEARRWGELELLERAGAINCLQRQVVFVLAPKVSITGELRARPALRYVADFTYQEHGASIVEDWKSAPTRKLPAFRLKQHLMKTVLGLEIRLTGS